MQPSGPGLLVTRPGGSLHPAMVSRVLGEQDLWVSELGVRRRNLEQVYLEVTGPVGGAA